MGLSPLAGKAEDSLGDGSGLGVQSPTAHKARTWPSHWGFGVGSANRLGSGSATAFPYDLGPAAWFSSIPVSHLLENDWVYYRDGVKISKLCGYY